MDNIRTFFNVAIPNSGVFSAIGNFFFEPLRYLFAGKTVWIDRLGEEKQEVTHTSSFHSQKDHTSRVVTYLREQPDHAFSRTNQYNHHSEPKNWLATVGSIVMLIPGVVLGAAFKGLAYCSSSMRARHDLATEHLKPINIKIGTALKGNRLLSQAEVNKELEKHLRNPMHPKVDSLIIRAANDVVIRSFDKRIQALNPKKIILDGPQGINSQESDLVGTYAKLTAAYVPPIKQVGSVQEALSDKAEKRALWHGGKAHKMMYQVNH